MSADAMARRGSQADRILVIKHGALGDIILACETVTREAAEQGKSPADHLSHLTVHAVLHLQAQGVVAEEDEALEKGFRKARFGCLWGGIEGNVGAGGCMLGGCWNRGVSAGVEWRDGEHC